MSKSTSKQPEPKSVIFTIEQMEGAEEQFDDFVTYQYQRFHSFFCDALARRKRWLHTKATLLPIFLLLLLTASAVLGVVGLVPRLPLDKPKTSVVSFFIGIPLALSWIGVVKLGDRWERERDEVAKELRDAGHFTYPRLDILNRLRWQYCATPTPALPKNECQKP